jgi:hypothetical protein
VLFAVGADINEYLVTHMSVLLMNINKSDFITIIILVKEGIKSINYSNLKL